MRLSALVLIVLCFMLAGGTVGVLFYSNYIIYDVKDVPIAARVSDHVGFNLTTDRLNFGRVTSPGGAERAITINNDYGQRLKVQMYISGDTADWVYSKESTLIIEPNTSRDVMMGISIPANIPEGNYGGNLRIVFTRMLV